MHDSPLSVAAVGKYTVWAIRTVVLWGTVRRLRQRRAVDHRRFISSGEAKWGWCPTSLLQLPHGRGQGIPDHLCPDRTLLAVGGWKVRLTIAMPSTPSNYHLLRRHAWTATPADRVRPSRCYASQAAVQRNRDFTEIKFRSVLEEPTYRMA